MNLDPLMMKNFEGTMFPPSQTAFAAYSDDWSTVTTKVVIPKDIFKSEGHRVLEKNAAVGYMVIRNIGDLLPKSFDAQMRESKYKVEVNSDVVSVRMPGMENIKLKDPIQITFYNRYVNRSEYICVFWNYSVPNTRGGGWSTNGCRRVAVNWTHTTCACTHMTSFAVLSDLNLEVSSIKIGLLHETVTWGLKKSNATDIHKNLIAAIVLAEAVFLAGINRTEDETACRLIAILLHYFFSTVFTWMLVEAVHMYRRLSEKRNVDTGRMNFYYFLGWGCPAVVVGISAGLTTDGYGSKHLAGLRASAILLPLLGVTLVFAILMVNKDLEMFHYSFAALTCFQGLFIFLFYCLFDKKVRKEFKNAYVRWKTGDKTYGIPKPVQHFKRSYHPGEMTAVRSPYHYDEDDGGNTSTSEPSSSMPSSTAGTSRPTSTAYSTGMSIPDSSVRSAGDGLTGSEVELDEILPKAKAKYYPDNPELEKARKMWETPEKGEHSTTNPESSSDDENRNPSPVILSDTSESSGDEQIPNGEEKTPEKSRKNHKAAPFYASDGPMHSTPIDTTPEEEPDMKKKAFDDSDSSDTEEEDKALERPLKEHPKFTSTPEIIPDVVASGSAATTSDTTPDTPILALKKPLKSALKKPRSSHTEEPSPASPLLLDNNDEPYEAAADKSPESSVADSQSRSKSRKEKKRRKHRPSRDRKPFVKFGNRGSLMSEPSEICTYLRKRRCQKNRTFVFSKKE
ncbi:Cadherin EGF LAG seven-pass G-type receptor 2 [Exaiptasia diaphana]|nr:Cadherin EGF LAG seven-pass G-type receptor 2 [Exaiptasia diaphana]